MKKRSTHMGVFIHLGSFCGYIRTTIVFWVICGLHVLEITIFLDGPHCTMPQDTFERFLLRGLLHSLEPKPCAP